MAQQRGATVKIVVGFEETFATPPTEGFILPINSTTLKPAQAINAAATLTGTRNPVQPFRGNKDVGGQIVIPVDTRAMWYWLRAMFGLPVTAGSAAPYLHTFTVPDLQPSLTIEEQMGSLAAPRFFRYKGCKISTAAITVGGDGELIMTLTVVGADFEIATSSFAASPTPVGLSRVHNFQAAVTEGGATLSNAPQIELNVDMGLDADTFVIGGGGVRGDINEGILSVGGSLTTLFKDDTLLVKAIDSAESALKVTVTGNASSIFELEMPEINYAVNGPEVQGPQGLRVTLEFQAYHDDGAAGSAIVARLTNADAHA